MGRLQQTSDEEIIRVARECFKQHGPQVSTAEIANRLNISQATLFSRFGTKKSLLLAALGVPDGGEWLNELKEGPNDQPLPDQLRHMAQSFAEHYRAVAPNIAMLRSAGISPKEAYAEAFDSQVQPNEVLADWLRRAYEHGLIIDCDFRSIGLALLGMFQMHPFMQLTCEIELQNVEEREYLSHAIKMIVDGIGKN